MLYSSAFALRLAPEVTLRRRRTRLPLRMEAAVRGTAAPVRQVEETSHRNRVMEVLLLVIPVTTGCRE